MKKISLYNTEKTDCCGCGACKVECPKNAIEMVEDEFGALYPQINEEICIKCGKCINSCSYKKEKNGSDPIEVFGAVNQIEKLYSKSASGGVFSIIASNFVNEGGIVVGSIERLEDGKIDCKHIVGKSFDEVEMMFGSKYVQSRSYETFVEIKKELSQGKKVLFSGTPCQVAALKGILKNHENLYTIDLICHGTPPLKIFQEFIKVMEKRLHSKVEFFSFRDKNAGRGFRASIKTKNKIFYLSHGILSYYKLFLDGVIYRNNCYSCPYACKERVSDITLGDYWGIEKYYSETEVGDKYWSGVLVNSTKGQELLDIYGGDLKLLKSDFESVAFTNEQLKRPHAIPESRMKYLDLYSKYGYKGIEREYRKNMGGNIKMFLKEHLQIIKNYL